MHAVASLYVFLIAPKTGAPAFTCEHLDHNTHLVAQFLQFNQPHEDTFMC